MTTYCRSGDHVIRDARDRATSGGCRYCAARNASRYRAALVSARRRLAELDATT